MRWFAVLIPLLTTLWFPVWAEASDQARQKARGVELVVEPVEEAAAGEDAPTPGFDLRARKLDGLPSSMAAMVLTGEDGGQLIFSPLALPLGPVPESGDRHHLVALLIEIDGGSLAGLESPEAEVSDLEVYVYALTDDGAVSTFSSQRIPVELDTFGEAVAAGGLKLLGHLELDPGRYRLRILIHEPSSRRFGLRELTVTVPDRGPVLSPPLFGEPPAPWVVVAEPLRTESPPLDFETLTRRTGAPVPSALPVVAGEVAELRALLYGVATDRAPQVRARLRPIEGGPTLDVGATVLEDTEAPIPGTRRLHLRLPLEKVESGSYFLKLTARVDRTDVESPEIGVIVFAEPSRDALVWTDVQRLARGEPPRAELETGRGRRKAARKRNLVAAISTAYRAVLERVTTGDWEGAVDDLLRVEQQALERRENGAFALIREGQLAVHEELMERDPEALVPIGRLHQEAVRRSRDRHRFGLAAHSRAMAAAVAEAYADRGDEDTRPIAAGLLAALGDELQQAHLYRSARRYLRQAIDIESSNTFALLQLAVGLERAGEYAQTVDVLERLVEVDPKSPEARLRLGLSLLRLGRVSSGTATLQRLTREQNPPWVLAVAYESLAMTRLRHSDPEGAVALLEEALVRMPTQDRLRLQLAYALERAGRTAESHQVLTGIGTTDGGGYSPRHRYSLWPSGGREETEESLARAAMIRLPALSRALAATAEEETR